MNLDILHTVNITEMDLLCYLACYVLDTYDTDSI